MVQAVRPVAVATHVKGRTRAIEGAAERLILIEGPVSARQDARHVRDNNVAGRGHLGEAATTFLEEGVVLATVARVRRTEDAQPTDRGRRVLQVDGRLAGCGARRQDLLHAFRAEPLKHQVVVPAYENLMAKVLRAKPRRESYKERFSFRMNTDECAVATPLDVPLARLGETVTRMNCPGVMRRSVGAEKCMRGGACEGRE